MTILLETKRLIVKSPNFDDLNAWVTLHMDADVRRLMYTKAKDALEVKEWMALNIEHQQRFGYSVASVFEKDTHHFVGRAGLMHVENNFDHPDVEVDCYLLPVYWKKAYGKELLQALFQLGFERFGLKKIVAVVNQINEPAILLAQSVGMQSTGIQAYQGVNFKWFEKLHS